MTSISKKAIVAAVTAVIGLGAIAPAMAQTAPAAPQPPTADAPMPPDANGPMGGPGHRPHDGGPRRGGGEGFLDFGRGGEGIEIAIVRLSHRIDLTAEQKTLLETFKTDALAAAETFTTATEGLRPTPPAEGTTATAPTPPTFTERLDNRIAMEKAQLAALEAVQPSAKAFFDSLTAEQQAQLTPQRGEPGFGPHGRPGQHGGPNGKGQHGRPGQMGAPDQPATPAEAPTEALPQT